MNRVHRRTACAMLLSGFIGAPALAQTGLPAPMIDQSAVARRGYFYVGGKYVGEPGKEIMQGQIAKVIDDWVLKNVK